MVDVERGIYIRPTTGLPAQQPDRSEAPLGSLTLSGDIRQTFKEIKESIFPPKPETFPPEEW